jgi:hypothetical protein
MLRLIAALALASQDRLECTADTMLCMIESEEHLSNGLRSNHRLKGIENLALLNFDVAPLKGRIVQEARLYFFPMNVQALKTLGLSSVGAPWKEGSSHGDAAKVGEPTFRKAAHGERDWAHPGSDFHAVSFGRGGSIWYSRDLRTEPDGRISVDLPPALLHALLEGNSFGIAVSDDKQQTGANNSVYSREQSGKAPHIRILRSMPGTPPPSGARKTVVPPAPPAADGSADLLKAFEARPAPAPASVDGVRWKVFHEGETNVDAAPAGDLWDGKTVTLHAARGEHVAFQVALELPEARPLSAEGWSVLRVKPVQNTIDPLVPLEGGISGKVMLHAERLIPKTAAPGKQSLPLTLRAGRTEIAVKVDVVVHSATLPDALNFAISLNTYQFPRPERDFMRLAHEHRATLAVVPYSHRGSLLDHVAPAVKREGFKVTVTSWDAYDQRWGPYLDGSAFKGLPRDGVPLDHQYWPMHEQWPIPINDGYGYKGKPGDHWRDALEPEQAFAPDFGKAFQDMIRDFAAHAVEKGWLRTRPHVFLNNKPNIRLVRKEPEGAWWRLDEPLSVDDHLALRYFAVRTKAAAAGFPTLPIRFRADLSRPQCRRDLLDGLIGLDVVAGLYKRYPELVFGRGEDVWVYGGVPNPSGSGQWGRAWALRSFLDGADGIVPWQSIGDAKAFERLEDTALILPGPTPTLRLKGLRRGQQDVELLRLLLEKRKLTRDAVKVGVSDALGLAEKFTKTSEEDAGRVDFNALDPARFEAVRRSLLEALDR